MQRAVFEGANECGSVAAECGSGIRGGAKGGGSVTAGGGKKHWPWWKVQKLVALWQPVVHSASG